MKDDTRGYTFFHAQATDLLREGVTELYLGFATTTDADADAVDIAREIVQVLQQHGLVASWAGAVTKKIRLLEMKADWLARFPQDL